MGWFLNPAKRQKGERLKEVKSKSLPWPLFDFPLYLWPFFFNLPLAALRLTAIQTGHAAIHFNHGLGMAFLA